MRSKEARRSLASITAFWTGSEGTQTTGLLAQFAQAVTPGRGQGNVKVLRSIWDCDDPRVKLEALARIYLMNLAGA